MFIRPFDTIIWGTETPTMTLIIEDEVGNLYRHTTSENGIHISEVEGWVKIEDFEDDWVSYIESEFSGTWSPETNRMNRQVTEKIRLHMHPPVPERSQGDVLFEIIETLLEEAIESRDDDQSYTNRYAVGYDDGKVAGLRTALRSIKEFLD